MVLEEGNLCIIYIFMFHLCSWLWLEAIVFNDATAAPFFGGCNKKILKMWLC